MSNSLQSRLVKSIVSNCENSKDLITDLGWTFSDKNPIYTHVGYLMEDKIFIFQLEEWRTMGMLGTMDFVPLPGLSRMKLEKSTTNLSLHMNKEGIIESITPIDQQYTPTNRVINPEYEIKNKSQGIVSLILRRKLSLIPNMWAIFVDGNHCEILGYLPQGEMQEMDYNEWELVNEIANEALEELHEFQMNKAKQKYIVHASIADRCKDESISVPLGFLSNEAGRPFEKPMVISFSPKMEREYNLDESTEIIMFRDSGHIYFSIRCAYYSNVMLRLPLDEITNSKDNVTSKAIQRSISRNLGLNKRKGVIDIRKSRKILLDLPLSRSRVGFSIKSQTMMTRYTGPHPSGKGFMGETDDEYALLMSTIIPQIMHLFLAKLDPALRGEIRIARKNFTPQNKSIRPKKTNHRILKWGTDRVRYVTGNGADGTKKSKHWVSPHTARYYLKKKESIEKYRKNIWLIIRENSRIIGIRPKKGHYRGLGKISHWDGTYNFGKTIRSYSRKQINWLKSIEDERGIKIQHAESGGELKIPTSNSFILLDGYCKETHTAFEFHGDVWHGNPKIYNSEDKCHPHKKDWTAGELFQKTKEREEIIKSLGFNLEVIWEADWDSKL